MFQDRQDAGRRLAAEFVRFKDVTAVVNAAHDAGLARLVARLEPLVCIKG
jgi:RNA-splicing ligase RtcB